jgi:hypothetical protein
MQQAIMDKFGYSNQICGWTQVRETLKSLLRLSGIQDYNKYFPFVPPEALQQMDQQAQQQSQEMQQQQQAAQMEQQKLMTSMVEIEKSKADLKYQSDMASVQQKHQAEMQKMQAKIAEMTTQLKYDATELMMKDDLERDKMMLTFTVQAAQAKLNAIEIANAKKEVDETREVTNVN